MIWIKFCGFVRPEDFEFAIKCDVNAVGIIAVPGTPRCITPDEAKVLGNLPRKKSNLVLVMQEPNFEYAQEMIYYSKPDLLQFHGEEATEFVEQFQIPYIKAFRSTFAMNSEKFHRHMNAFAWLVDSELQAEGLNDKKKIIILGGKLNAANVVDRVSMIEPWGVDISRGIEATPRKKNFELMMKFVKSIREAKH